MVDVEKRDDSGARKWWTEDEGEGDLEMGDMGQILPSL